MVVCMHVHVCVFQVMDFCLHYSTNDNQTATINTVKAHDELGACQKTLVSPEHWLP